MSNVFMRLALVAGLGVTVAACQGDSYGAPRGYQPGYQTAPVAYGNSGYYAPAPAYGYGQAAPNYYYGNQYTNQQARPGMATVTVTNRGQNGYRDDVVQQNVPCGSQYYDGYRQRTARC
ncbi:MAG: hypothetical protein EPO67_17660 [Reyranella sp.]|jgi:hypothetical protein|nr:MAG: hypothetical protein EPO67_17660 [Reyranella sp.]